MFDFDAGKLLIIGVVALIVIGPKELPRVLRQVGQTVSRLRRMANEFQGQFMDAMKEADIQNIRDEMTKLGKDAELNTVFDPVHEIRTEMTGALAQGTALVAPSAPAIGSDKGFDLPKLPETPVDSETETPAAAGFAPVVADEEVLRDAEPGHASTDPAPELDAAAAKKRKIVLARRRPAPSVAAQAGATGPMASRFRNVRPRRHEATEQ